MQENSTPVTNDGSSSDPKASRNHVRRRQIARLLARPRSIAAIAVAVAGVLSSAGVFGVSVLRARSAVSATSLAAQFQSAATTIYQTTPTGTTCSQFTSGTATTLSQLQYSLKGTTISQTNPGVFFYWATVTAFQAGLQTHTVFQVTSPFYPHYFAVADGSNVYTSSCVVVHDAVISPTTSTGTNTVTFNAPTAGAIYYIGIKYNVNSVVGAPKPPNPGTVLYTFKTDDGAPVGVQLVKK